VVSDIQYKEKSYKLVFATFNGVLLAD
jgi:hypothetical protein